MRVGIDTENLYIHRKAQRILDNKVALAGRDVKHAVVLKLEQHRMLRWGSIGEVKANLGGSHLRLARKFEMHIEDQVIARIESPWHALRFNQHRRIGFPK